MKENTVIRRADNLGRIVIPIEMRRKLGINDGDALEITLTDKGIEIRKNWFHERMKVADKILRSVPKNVTFLTKDNMVICVSQQLVKNKHEAKIGVAMCNPNDTFYENVGKAIAYLRMTKQAIPLILLG